MKDKLKRIKVIASEVENGSRDAKKAFVVCIRALADEVRELREEVRGKRKL